MDTLSTLLIPSGHLAARSPADRSSAAAHRYTTEYVQKWVQTHSSEAQQLTKPLLIEEFGRKLAPSHTESGTDACPIHPPPKVHDLHQHLAAEADGRRRPLQRSDKGLHRVGTPHSGCCWTSWKTQSARAPLPFHKWIAFLSFCNCRTCYCVPMTVNVLVTPVP
jgi:hypothetical protein